MRADVMVIGGGAAGCMAAITAAEQGRRVLLLERNPKLGRKLYITGKGRCNLTNRCTPEEVLRHTPRNGKFLYSVMSAFPPEAVMAFFEEMGVPLKTERGDRVFPVSDRAADVVDALLRRLRKERVTILEERVTALTWGEDGLWRAETEQGGSHQAPAAVLATGGLSYPRTGSTGDGFHLAQALGHTVTPLRGSLVPLECGGDLCPRMQGLSLRNVLLTVREDRGKTVYREQGELLFTHFGLSGPLVLSASAHLRDFDRRSYTAVIDLKPALDEDKLDARLLREFSEHANQNFSTVLATLVPRLMIPVLEELTGIPGDMKVNGIRKEERARLRRCLKGVEIPITAARPVEEAVVTSGGVKVSEVDPKTMESKIVKGLYFAGEMLDVDAYTGGFNLQIAWATGRRAGLCAAGVGPGKERGEG